MIIGGGGFDTFYFDENWGQDTIILCNQGDAVLEFADGISGIWDESALKYTCGDHTIQIICREEYTPYVSINDGIQRF